MKLKIKESEGATNNLLDILLNRLKPYENTFNSVKNELPENSLKLFENGFNWYRDAFTKCANWCQENFPRCTFENDNIYTRMEYKASPSNWERWRHTLFGNAKDADVKIVPYVIKVGTKDVSTIKLTDGSIVLGLPTDNANAKEIRNYGSIFFTSRHDAENFAHQHKIPNYQVVKYVNNRTWSRDLISVIRSMEYGNIVVNTKNHTPFITWTDYAEVNTSQFIDFTTKYPPFQKPRFVNIVIKPLIDQYHFRLKRDDAGDDYSNTEYTLTTEDGAEVTLIYYAKGPASHPLKHSVELYVNRVITGNDYEDETFLLDDYENLTDLMNAVKQTVERYMDNYYSKENN